MGLQVASTFRQRLSPRQREALEGYLYISPWFIGFLIFTGGPLIASLFLSFTKWGFVDQPRFIGLENYQHMLKDPIFWIALRVTALFTALSVPTVIVVALFTALLITRPNLKGARIFRTIYYLPSVVGGIPMALLWTWIFNPDYGILNRLLSMVGLPGPNWLGSPQSALLAIVMVSAWNFGLPMVVFIAGLQNIPPVLYEAANLDGATVLSRLRFITLPMLSSTFLFILVNQIIGAFQVFDLVFVISQGNGSPLRSTLMYLLYFYQNAFRDYDMGYASALVWVLFLVIMALTVLIFKSSSLWVYYESEAKND
jgi:multiple sugar transport system permease protein